MRDLFPTHGFGVGDVVMRTVGGTAEWLVVDLAGPMCVVIALGRMEMTFPVGELRLIRKPKRPEIA